MTSFFDAGSHVILLGRCPVTKNVARVSIYS